MDKLSLSDALHTLTKSSVNRSKIGRLRELLSEVEVAQRAGVTIKEIVGTLKTQGLDFNQKSFESTLYRIRKEQGKTRIQRKAISAAPGPAVSAPVEREEKQNSKAKLSIGDDPSSTESVGPDAVREALNADTRNKKIEQYGKKSILKTKE